MICLMIMTGIAACSQYAGRPEYVEDTNTVETDGTQDFLWALHGETPLCVCYRLSQNNIWQHVVKSYSTKQYNNKETILTLPTCPSNDERFMFLKL